MASGSTPLSRTARPRGPPSQRLRGELDPEHLTLVNLVAHRAGKPSGYVAARSDFGRRERNWEVHAGI